MNANKSCTHYSKKINKLGNPDVFQLMTFWSKLAYPHNEIIVNNQEQTNDPFNSLDDFERITFHERMESYSVYVFLHFSELHKSGKQKIKA